MIIKITVMKKFLYITTLLFSFVSYSQIANQPSDIEMCDTNNDGIEEFDLTITIVEILNSQNANDFQITFHLSQSDALNDTNRISSPTQYTNSTLYTTIYARLTDLRTNTFDTTSFEIIAKPTWLVSPVTDFYVCDDVESGSDQDGISIIDLLLIVDEVRNLNGTNNMEVIIYPTEADAITDTNNVPYSYTNTNPTETLYFRIFGPSTHCNDIIGSFSINVIECDNNDADGVSDADEDLNLNRNLADDDTDMDGLPNYMDNDDDNDGILTINEDYNLNGDPTDDDTDNSGVADYLEANVALNINSFELKTFKIYPNPIKDKLFIQGFSNPTKISIYNVLGKLVLSKTISSEIDVNNLQSGIYIIKIFYNQKEIVRKFIKN